MIDEKLDLLSKYSVEKSNNKLLIDSNDKL